MSAGNWKDLYNAVKAGDLALVEFHISHGADPNFQHAEIMTTVLIESLERGHLDIAKFLLLNGADPNIKQLLGGKTALVVASEMGYKKELGFK